MDLIITRERLAAWEPCGSYPAERIAELIPPDGVHLREALQRSDVPVEDLIWLATRRNLLPESELRLFACRCARRALDRIAKPDPRSIASIETAERYARGEATAGELAASQSSAWAAVRQAEAAARAAAWAADAARAATWAALAADEAAERATQIADLLTVIDRLEASCEP